MWQQNFFNWEGTLSLTQEQELLLPAVGGFDGSQGYIKHRYGGWRMVELLW